MGPKSIRTTPSPHRTVPSAKAVRDEPILLPAYAGGMPIELPSDESLPVQTSNDPLDWEWDEDGVVWGPRDTEGVEPGTSDDDVPFLDDEDVEDDDGDTSNGTRDRAIDPPVDDISEDTPTLPAWVHRQPPEEVQ